VLAAAGLQRLGFGPRISAHIGIDDCVPAPGQGIIAVEIRATDHETADLVSRISHGDTFAAFVAERALVTGLGGGCQMPIGGIALPFGADELELCGLVASLDGARVIRYKEIGERSNPAGLGRHVADELLRRGASDILEEVRQHESRIADPNSLRLT
jgi:hydroxymethylbilane synthase